MADTSQNEAIQAKLKANYDRASELKAFDETKAGVKGLVDSGVAEIPRIFHLPPSDDLEEISSSSGDSKFSIPVIDLGGVIVGDSVKRKKIVERVREASERWGFFQIVNHGILASVLEEMKDVVRRFHEQDTEVKKGFYTRDPVNPVVYNSNFDLYNASSTNWRDSFSLTMFPNPPNPQDLPIILRGIFMDYSKQVMRVGILLFELLSEALGLNPNHLNDIDCAEGLAVSCHYYPACPQPELTRGTTEHADADFITILLQDHLGGLQVLHQSNWIDIAPEPGALVVNIGDMLQLISNDRFKSVRHRVLANRIGPRISVASFFSTCYKPTSKLYGPIKELLSESNPPKYRETTVRDCLMHFKARGLGQTSTLDHFELPKEARKTKENKDQFVYN